MRLGQSDLLEIGTDGEDFVYQIFDRQNVIFAESVLDDRVIGQRYTLAVDFAVAALVDQLADSLQVWLAETMVRYMTPVISTNHVPICNVGLHKTEHLLSCLRHTNEHTAVDLHKAEELKDFSGFRCNFVDTTLRVSGHGFGQS